MAVITHVANPAGGRLRPFDVRRDMNGVADLVELCFAETLDRDGQRYLKQMRDAARSSHFIHWASRMVEHASLPLSGYVWVEDGHLVGNLSLIPFFMGGQRCYLIANVAVHPEFRRRGIARALTSSALKHAGTHRASAAWLHVRHDNDPAIRLYHSLGFQERARRTTWHSHPSALESFLSPLPAAPDRVAIRPGRASHWPQIRSWLRRIYPPEIAWHLPLNYYALQPNLWGGLVRMFSGMQVRHWVAQNGGRLLGALTWQNAHAYADALWLAAPAPIDGGVIKSLLQAARQEISPRRLLALDFPANVCAPDIQAAGFQVHHTLIWMEAPLLV